jgi:translation initiation factor IF-1
MIENSEVKKEIGIVVEALPNTLFRIQVEGEEKLLLAYLAGKMRLHRIKVIVGDKVEFIRDNYGGKARVTRRM